jgi:uncharacterized secreted protein with C-terminal beta-propeller domain
MNINKIMLNILLLLVVSTVSACSNNDETATAPTNKPVLADEHFLKEKLETIKKAEAVEQLIMDTASQQRQVIEAQSQ